MNRLIIADIKSPNNRGICTGHFFAVARNYYELFKNRINILVAGGPIYHSQFKDIQMELPYDVCLQEESLWKNKWKYLQNARSLFKQAEEDTIILQQGGVATSFIAIVLFYHCKSKLYLIQYSLEGLDSPIKRLLYYFAKHKIDGIICPNDMVGKGYRKPYCIVPDYIYIDNPKEKTVPYKDKKYDIGFVGRIEEEKGIFDVAKKIICTDYQMIIAGKVRSKEMENKLKAICDKGNNIELHIGYVSDTDYKEFIRNSRFCILNYQGEYSRRSSGVVFDTLFNDVPIIGKRCKALNFIEENTIGYIYDNLDNLDLDKIMTENNYNTYIANIAIYKDKHKEYKEKLSRFLGI